MAGDLRDQLQLSLGEAYRIERELGGGGMSRVFLALETSLGRQVVVKVLLPELAVGVSVDRFRREIQVAAHLQHPHIVPLLAAGESAGLPYFTMPFVNGESLRARVARDGELPVAEAVRVLRDIASALAYAHAQGVVHRDIKPDNVLLSHGVAVVTDFGVAKALTVSTGPDAAGHGPGITSIGVTLGTPAYMAPEQATADPNMDHRVDIYAFGATAYEMLTGEPVFAGRTAQAILGAHLAVLPEPITLRRPGLPPMLALLIMRCLEKRPADRPQTATEVMNALDLLTTPSGGTVPIPALRSVRGERWRRAVPAGVWRYSPVAAAIALAVGAAVWAGSRFREPAGTPAVTPAPPAPPAAAPNPASAPAMAPVDTAIPAPPVQPSAGPPPARQPSPSRPRTAPAAAPAPTPLAVEEAALLARLGEEARAARVRAVAAGAADSLLARGDSQLVRADSLAARRKIAAAAAQLTRTAALWSGAADAARTPPPSPPPAPVPARDSLTRPPAPVPGPTPAPAPPRPASDPAPEIRALFVQYGAAIESRSVDAIRRVYPDLSPEQAQEWEQFFQGVGAVTVELDLSDLETAGDAAEAKLAGVYVFTDPGTRRVRRENVAFQAALRRVGGSWRIASLR